MEKASELVGLGVRQGYRLWSLYQKEGVKGLIKPAKPRRKPKLDAAGQQALLEETAKGELATLGQVQQWLEQEKGVQYTQQGVWYVLKRLKIKLKTGRPGHYQQDKAAADAFKKTLLLG
jgi:transposase